MNSLIKYTVAILLGLTGSLLWPGSAFAAKPTKDVVVTAADPDFALQGQDLDVTIIGSGFDRGSTVRFLVGELEDDTQVEVTGEILFVKQKGKPDKLIVPIHVLNAALVEDYDVEVTTSSGRRGKGTGLFSVKKFNDPVVLYTVTSAGTNLVSGTDWQETNKGQIDSKGGISLLDLSYFRDQFGPSGDACFPEGTTLFVGGFKKQGKNALGRFWFIGRTRDLSQQVLYLLTLDGGAFDDPRDWPPAVSNFMTWTRWEMKVENEGSTVASLSCEDEGVPDIVPTILIETQ